jgi:hypothetical protein
MQTFLDGANGAQRPSVVVHLPPRRLPAGVDDLRPEPFGKLRGRRRRRLGGCGDTVSTVSSVGDDDPEPGSEQKPFRGGKFSLPESGRRAAGARYAELALSCQLLRKGRGWPLVSALEWQR